VGDAMQVPWVMLLYVPAVFSEADHFKLGAASAPLLRNY
jgi:hypothetical protein